MVDTFWILVAGLVILLVWNILLTIFLFSTRKKNEVFFDDDSKNLRDLVTRSINDAKAINTRAAKIEDSIDQISKIIKNSYQKFAVIRYNPFSDTGGDLSFSMALLDLDDNGYVLTNIHGREVDRIYAKEVIKGKSKHNMSAEEVEALRRALDEK